MHDRSCTTPSISTRHSKQIPIPHNAARRPPLTDSRHAFPAFITAAATLDPGTIRTEQPSTKSSITSLASVPTLTPKLA